MVAYRLIHWGSHSQDWQSPTQEETHQLLQWKFIFIFFCHPSFCFIWLSCHRRRSLGSLFYVYKYQMPSVDRGYRFINSRHN